MWNNETINIWSHLFGFFVFLTAALTDHLATPTTDQQFTDRLYMTLGMR